MSFFIYLVVTVVLGVGAFVAYQQGYADPLIEQIGVYFFKAKAQAEKKELEAQGKEAGQDFLSSQLSGSKQADDVQDGIGAIGELKKNL